MKVAMILSMILALSCNKILNEDSIILANKQSEDELLISYFQKINNIYGKYEKCRAKNERITKNIDSAEKKLQDLNKILQQISNVMPSQTENAKLLSLSTAYDNLQIETNNLIINTQRTYNTYNTQLTTNPLVTSNPIINDFKLQLENLKNTLYSIESNPQYANMEITFNPAFDSLLKSYPVNTMVRNNIVYNTINIDYGISLVVSR